MGRLFDVAATKRSCLASVRSVATITTAASLDDIWRCCCGQVLRPVCHIQSLHFWDAVYLSETAPAVAGGANSEQFEAAGSDVSSSSAVTSPDQQVTCLPAKTRSCDDLTKTGLNDDDDDIAPIMSAQRRLSDPNIAAHSAAAEAAASAPSETHNELDDDVGDVRTAVSCEQADNDVVNCSDHQHNEADSSDSADVTTATTVSLVAVTSQKCASSETLKAVEDATCDLSCSEPAPSDGCPDNVLNHAGVSDPNSPSVLAMFQASSDTLTGEDGHPPAVTADELSAVDSSAVASSTDPVTPATTDELLPDVVGVHSQVLKMKTMLDRCSSTSDISSSHVVDNSAVLMNGGTGKAVTPLTVDTKLALTAASGNGTTVRGVVNGDVDGAGISQPASSCSTSPPTPNSDVKVCLASRLPCT